MKAAVTTKLDGTFNLAEVDLASPLGREVLVQVKAAGLCHSDLVWATNGLGTPIPAVFGHELSGVVTEIGSDVTEFAVGDHVVGSLVQFCGHCDACLSGRTYQCANPSATLRDPALGSRLTQDGEPVSSGFGTAAFAEFSLVHENQLAKIPDDVPFPQAAILGCSVVTGAGAAVNTAHVHTGDTVAVIGVGGVGLNVISGAKLAGASRIIAIDLQPQKLELAKKFGATDVINSGEVDAVEAVHALTGGGVDHSFEAIGLKVTTEQSLKMLKIGGGAYAIGLHKPGSTIDVDVLFDLLATQRRLQGVYMGSSNIKHDIPMYANLYLQGRLNLDDLISKEINLSEINEAYEEIKHGAIARSVVTSF